MYDRTTFGAVCLTSSLLDKFYGHAHEIWNLKKRFRVNMSTPLSYDFYTAIALLSQSQTGMQALPAQLNLNIEVSMKIRKSIKHFKSKNCSVVLR